MESFKKLFDLTQGQLMMWTGQELNPDSPLYNMVLLFEIKGAINTEHFSSAFQILVNQSDALRMVFTITDGIPQQRALDYFPYDMKIVDCTQSREPFLFFRKKAVERSRRIFDLSVCAFDSVLYKISDEKYIWFFNQHHLITDAWAVSVLFRAMSHIYSQLLKGMPSEIKPLPLFHDYIDFEKITRMGAQMEEAKKYWQEKIKSAPVAMPLYGQKNNPRTSRSERVFIDLGAKRSSLLQALAQEHDVRSWTKHLSLFNIFSTALFAYLHRVSNQQELIIGTPAHNRTTANFKETPGVFIELFPMLAEVREELTFADLLQQVRTEANGFLRYAQPGASRPELSRRFNVVLNYIHAVYPDFNGIPTSSEWLHPGHCDPRHHLRLQVLDFDNTGNIQLHFDLNEELFNPEMRKTAPGHFLKILDAFITDRTQEIGAVNLLTDREQTQGVFGFNNNNLVDFDDKNIIELFEKQVAETPNAPAVSFEKITLTYAELNAKANQLAHYLKNNKITNGHRVALFLNRSLKLVISILAVLKTGASYIPIAANYPKERIKYMLTDSGSSMLLTKSPLKFDIHQCSSFCEIIDLEDDWKIIAQQENTNLNTKYTLENLAYIMYTSGSTGKPKGVMISHGALANYLKWAAQKYIGSKKITAPLFTSIGFDLTVTSLFLPIITGGELKIYEENTTGPDLALFQVIKENKMDLIKLTPSHLALLIDGDLSGSRIRTMIVGGEDFKCSLAKNIQNGIGNELRIFNEYGPTEATVGCIVHQFDPDIDVQNSVPIGQPVANMEAYILDTFGNPVPQGVTGELYISGVALANGYWNKEEMTTKRFVPHVFQKNKKMYRTGDLARINSSNIMEYLGRMDQQVKIGGMRIELGEIESVVAQHPAVKDVVVVLRKRLNNLTEHHVTFCEQCGLPSNHPNAELDEKGVCGFCRSFETYQDKARQYFKTLSDLRALFDVSRKKDNGEYDCIMLLSGGKDSTYALGQLVEMGIKVLAFTLDNGYISEQAKANIRRVVNDLKVDHIFGETPAMNAIFIDSLHRHSNVCNGCFKTLYTLSTKIALEKNIPYIVTGLSRGQFFETRLTEELFWDENVDVAAIDATILNARKAYHRVDDAVCSLLDVSMFDNDEVFEKVQFVDFYRYTDVDLADMLEYLDKRLPWIRPDDTGRSTNCRINQVGIYIHKKEKGYNNYAFPYSWDVRIGHKTRDAALDEINEEIDEQEVQKILADIGFDEMKNNLGDEQLVAFYTSDAEIPYTDLRSHLSFILPDYMIPSLFIKLEKIPLSPNGKTNRDALPDLNHARPDLIANYVAPGTEIEEALVTIWSNILTIEQVGIYDNFLELGGHSLAAIRLVARMNEAFQLQLPVTCVFENPTIAALGRHVENTIMKLMEEMEE